MIVDPSWIPHGAAVFFHGYDDPLKAGAGAILSGIIEDVEHAPWSHCGYLSANGRDIFESTIWKGVSGPQWNQLADRLPEYRNGGEVVVMPYLPNCGPSVIQVSSVSEKLMALRDAGKCGYAVAHLVGDLFLDTELGKFYPFKELGERLMEDRGLVCSECLAMVRGLNPWIGVTPAQMYNRPEYGPLIQVI
jgi:hypothetical protein